MAPESQQKGIRDRSAGDRWLDRLGHQKRETENRASFGHFRSENVDRWIRVALRVSGAVDDAERRRASGENAGNAVALGNALVIEIDLTRFGEHCLEFVGTFRVVSDVRQFPANHVPCNDEFIRRSLRIDLIVRRDGSVGCPQRRDGLLRPRDGPHIHGGRYSSHGSVGPRISLVVQFSLWSAKGQRARRIDENLAPVRAGERKLEWKFDAPASDHRLFPSSKGQGRIDKVRFAECLPTLGPELHGDGAYFVGRRDGRETNGLASQVEKVSWAHQETAGRYGNGGPNGGRHDGTEKEHPKHFGGPEHVTTALSSGCAPSAARVHAFLAGWPDRRLAPLSSPTALSECCECRREGQRPK